ncbi:Hypothetical_protein [Hexamita inflata]|uniref:Hypothetical_protein n=1 Tax=Hexamita inflata TaxID=28002 RepID=A0AA86NPF5_9EUKA|nr:Hypothetical protein HINF_LOCUS10792 [Hexamita inflata]
MNITHKLSCVINLKIYTKQRLLDFLSSYLLIVITIKKSPPRNSKVVHQFKMCEKYRISGKQVEQDTQIFLKPNENYLILVHLHLKEKRSDCHYQLKYQNE